MAPTTRASNVWEVNSGDDLLQVIRPGGQVISGVDATGAGYGKLSGQTNVINVLNYGAVGDGVVDGITNQAMWIASASGTGITATVTISGNLQTFKSTDVGKTFTANAFGDHQYTVYGTIAQVFGPNQIQVKGNCGTGSTNLSGGIIAWGTENTMSFMVASAVVQAQLNNSSGQTYGPITQPPTLYIPSGVYLLDLDKGIPINLTDTQRGFTVMGDGSEQTVLVIANTLNSPTGVCIGASQGRVIGLTIEGADAAPASGGTVMSASGIITDIRFHRCGALNCLGITGGGSIVTGVNCIACAFNGIAVENADCDLYACVLSNNGGMGLQFLNSSGYGRFFGGLIDESGGTAGGASTNVLISNGAQNVSFYGTQIFAINTPAVTVTNGSKAFFSNCNIAFYQGHGGLKIDSTSTVSAVGSQIIALTFGNTPTVYSLDNQGTFNDLGGNRIALETPILSISESGSIGTFTLNGNHNLTAANIGDSILIYGIADLTGTAYNGTWAITSVPSAAVVTLQLSTTGLPSLNPPTGLPRADIITKFNGGVNGNGPTTSGAQNVYSFALAALSGNVVLGKFTPLKGNRLSRITVTSTATTSSSVAPVLTITNSNATKTLTLTSGQNSWDSGIISDTYFAPGQQVTVSLTQGSNTTAPANINVVITADSLGI